MSADGNDTDFGIEAATDLDRYRAMDATAVAQMVAAGEASVEEVTSLARAVHEASHDGPDRGINAVVEWYDHADDAERVGLGPTIGPGPLVGVPVLAKDYGAAVQGRLVEMGSALARGNRATRTSVFMRRLLRAGAVIVGRSATPEFIQHGTTESRVNGPTRNPHDRRWSAGGSSGGAGAAVAAGVVPIAHASDCAGSIRIPASTCGLVGLKPGRDRIPWTGACAASDWAGVASEFVLTRSVRDAKLFLEILGDGDVDRPPPTMDRRTIGLSATHWSGAAIDAGVAAATEAAARHLEEAGHRVVPIEPPLDYEQLMSTWHGLFSRWVAAEARDLSARLGRPVDETTVEPVTLHVIDEVDRLTANELLMTERRRAEITRRLTSESIGLDALLTPTLGRVTIPLGRVAGEWAEGETMEDYLGLNDELFPYSYLFNVTGWPSVSVPFARSGAEATSGMPIGVQLSGPTGSEGLLLHLADDLLADDRSTATI